MIDDIINSGKIYGVDTPNLSQLKNTYHLIRIGRKCIHQYERFITTEFFRLLSENSQRKVSADEFTEAINELATHVANFSINEQDYNVLLRYFPLACTVSNRTVYGLSKKKCPICI